MEEIQVETLEYKTAEAPSVLYANLGPCIGIGAIYEGKGYLLHTQPVGWFDFSQELNPILQDLKKDVKKKSKLGIYIAGCSLDGENDEEMLEGRKTTIETIAKAGFKDRIKKVKWADDNSTQTLYLILSENQADIEDDCFLKERDFY